MCFPRVSCSNPFGQILREVSLSAFCVRGSRPRGGAPPQLQRPSGRASVSEAGGPGPVVVSGCRNAVCGRAVVFHFRQSKKRGSLSSSVRLIRSLSTFAVETLLALRGAELRSWRGRCASAKHELDIIAKPWGLLHEALLSGRSFLAHRNSQLLSPLQHIACRLLICLVRCSPIFAVRHVLRRSRFAVAAFDLLVALV